MSGYSELDRLRKNPPCEDFAETRQLLKDERTKNEQLKLSNKRLTHRVKELEDMIADILDDTGGEPHVT